MDEQRGLHSLKELLRNPPDEFRIFERRAHTDDGYLDALDHAWVMMCAEGAEQTDVDAASAAITGCVCYALIRTSINSVAANYNPAIVGRAVELGLWPARRALSVATKIPKQDRKVSMYTALLGSEQLDRADNETVQRVALDATLALELAPGRMAALMELAPHLSEPALETAIDATFAPEHLEIDATFAPGHLELERNLILTVLAPYLRGAQLERALDTALTFKDRLVRGSSQSLQEGLLEQLVAHLSQAQLARALEVSLALEHDEVERAGMLVTLAPHSSEALPRAFDATLKLRDRFKQADLLRILAPHLNEAQLAQAVDALLALIRQVRLGIRTEPWSNEALARYRLLQGLAPHLNQAQLARVLDALLARKGATEQVTLLVALAPYMNEAQPLALDAVLALKDEVTRARLLLELARHVKEALPQALASVPALSDTEQAWLLIELARHAKEALPQALDSVLAVKDGSDQAGLLARLASHQSELLPWVIDTVLVQPAEVWQNRFVKTLVPHLNKHQLVQVLDTALVVEDSREIAGMLEALAQQAPALYTTAQETQPLEERLEAALNARDEEDRANQLAALAPHLDGPLLERVLTSLPREGQQRIRALVALLPRLEGALVQRVLDQLASEGEIGRAHGLIAIASRLTSTQAASAAAAALVIKDQRLRLQALVALLPRLADQAPLRKTIYQLLFGMVRALRERERRDLFELCAIPNLFAPPLFAEGTAAAIERQIREISETWRWL